YNGWNKIIDYHNRGPRPGGGGDDGLYFNNSNHLDWFPFASGPFTYLANQLVTVSTTRDNAGVITGSVNGVQQLSFTDNQNFGVFDQPNAIAWFFEDDTASNSSEVSSGFVDQILVYGPGPTGAALANGGNGVTITNSAGNTIGGTTDV